MATQSLLPLRLDIPHTKASLLLLATILMRTPLPNHNHYHNHLTLQSHNLPTLLKLAINLPQIPLHINQALLLGPLHQLIIHIHLLPLIYLDLFLRRLLIHSFPLKYNQINHHHHILKYNQIKHHHHRHHIPLKYTTLTHNLFFHHNMHLKPNLPKRFTLLRHQFNLKVILEKISQSLEGSKKLKNKPQILN